MISQAQHVHLHCLPFPCPLYSFKTTLCAKNIVYKKWLQQNMFAKLQDASGLSSSWTSNIPDHESHLKLREMKPQDVHVCKRSTPRKACLPIEVFDTRNTHCISISISYDIYFGFCCKEPSTNWLLWQWSHSLYINITKWITERGGIFVNRRSFQAWWHSLLVYPLNFIHIISKNCHISRIKY